MIKFSDKSNSKVRIIESYMSDYFEKNKVNVFDNAKRLRYALYNPQGEAYIRLVVEYKNNTAILYCFKFNCNAFVGERIDCNMEHIDITSQKVNDALRKDRYTCGTGIRTYIEME